MDKKSVALGLLALAFCTSCSKEWMGHKFESQNTGYSTMYMYRYYAEHRTKLILSLVFAISSNPERTVHLAGSAQIYKERHGFYLHTDLYENTTPPRNYTYYPGEP